jgi:hypothetical protein
VNVPKEQTHDLKSNTMANICENELHIFTESIENISAVTKFFNDKFPYCTIDDVGDNNIVIYFDSRWDFPKQAMGDLVEIIPDKENIRLDCLSVEWGNYYCAFHSYTGDKWVLK